MARQPSFQVVGNRIEDRHGRRVVLVGADTVYGRFVGEDMDGFGLQAYRGFRDAISAQFEYNHNAIRLTVSPQARDALGATFWSELDEIMRVATDHYRMIVVLAAAGTAAPDETFLRQLASRYQANPRVWIKPVNEPSPNGTWAAWRSFMNSAIATIRAEGNLEPVVLNAPGWSWDWRQYAANPLADGNLIVGAHRYANGQTFMPSIEVRAYWADLTETLAVAVIVDEWGNWNGSTLPGSPLWNQQFGSFLTDWVLRRGGSGVLAFNWGPWSDPNSMTGAGGRLTSWGSDFMESTVELRRSIWR